MHVVKLDAGRRAAGRETAQTIIGPIKRRSEPQNVTSQGSRDALQTNAYGLQSDSADDAEGDARSLVATGLRFLDAFRLLGSGASARQAWLSTPSSGSGELEGEILWPHAWSCS